jgi:hypothetical protein
VEVSRRAADNIGELLPVRRESVGAIEGRLEAISIHRAKKFVVYHSITRKAVNCSFKDDEFLEEAKRALGERVHVSGVVKTNIKSEPVMVEVNRLRILGKGRLPTTGELTGSDPDFTGGLSTDEFIRRIRRA